LLLFIEMPGAKVFSEARVQPGRLAVVTVKSLKGGRGTKSFNLLRLVKQHYLVTKPGPTPSRKRVWRR
jgi:hypothetical protein